MPRAGSGGSRSSGSRSSGGHSSTRSSGGHRVSSSGSHSRAGSGHRVSSRPSFHGTPPPPPSRGPGMPPPFRGPGMPPPPPRSPRRRSYRRTYYGGSSGGSLVSAIVLIIVLLIAFAFISMHFSTRSFSRSFHSSAPVNTRSREKLNSGLSFDSNCIVDEIGWFDSVSKAGRQLKTFYDKTGVQPYIVLLQYHPELTTEAQKETYAQEYYENNIDNEATFLYMYFAEEDPDNDVGYMCYVNGKRVDSVMDSEAIDIFWGYLDRSWYSDMTTDALFEDAFTKTADTIMAKSRTTTNIVLAVVAGVIIIGIIAAINTKRKSKPE